MSQFSWNDNLIFYIINIPRINISKIDEYKIQKNNKITFLQNTTPNKDMELFTNIS